MKYRKLGNTGLIVSEVALGSMQFGGKMNMGNLGQEQATRMVQLALDRGINFIDTADVYSLGESETLLGNALKGIREEIVLATKVRLPMGENFNRSGATRVNIMREVEASLRRLQTDYIDLYQVHGWDSNTPLEETLRTLNDLVRHGKVRYIGLSNLMSWQAATAVMLQERLGLEKYVTAQMYYSLVGRELEYEFQSFAEDHISAVDLQLSTEDVRLLDEVSDPGVPYPKWMVLQLDTAEDPRPRVLHPEEYGEDGRWRDLRGSRWPG